MYKQAEADPSPTNLVNNAEGERKDWRLALHGRGGRKQLRTSVELWRMEAQSSQYWFAQTWQLGEDMGNTVSADFRISCLTSSLRSM